MTSPLKTNNVIIAKRERRHARNSPGSGSSGGTRQQFVGCCDERLHLTPLFQRRSVPYPRLFFGSDKEANWVFYWLLAVLNGANSRDYWRKRVLIVCYNSARTWPSSWRKRVLTVY